MTPEPHHPPLLASLAVAAILVWRVYARVRRTVGRQKLSRFRAWATIALFSLLLLLFLLGSLAHIGNAFTLVAGIGLGVSLGFYGLRLTKFENTPLGLFYTPSAHIGIALSLLFIGRVGYRVAQVYLAGVPTAPPSTVFVGSPLTLAFFGLLAGYYVTYEVGLLRWARRASLPTSFIPPEQPTA